MKIMVSACLLGKNCKYNGGNNYSKKVKEYCKGHKIIAVCPEVLGGLSIPRVPAEILDGIVINKDGVNVDKEFRQGAKKGLEKAIEEDVQLVILQSRSPSCGVKQVYDGTFSKQLVDGKGVFAQLLHEHGIPILDVEEVLT